MKTSLYIARRYIFSKKSHNVINIISGISAFGIFISSAAMVIVMSGFNGIENLVEDLYSSFDADIRIEKLQGKTFSNTLISKESLLEINEIANVTEVIEEITMIKNDNLWATATMKGVEDDYLNICALDSVLTEGNAALNEDGFHKTIIGIGLQNKLQVSSNPVYHDYITVYGLLRNEKISINNKSAFHPELISVGGVFAINPDFDHSYFLVPINFARNLLEYNDQITALEIGISKDADIDITKEKILALIGEGFSIKSRYEQNEFIFKTNETEKWMVFLILGFILLLSTFNIIASLTMLILDKKKDINTLISLGASTSFIKRVFFFEGLFINFMGGLTGILTGLLISWLQIEFQFVKLENSVISHWPVAIDFGDILLIFFTVIGIGIISSTLPVMYLVRKHFNHKFK